MAFHTNNFQQQVCRNSKRLHNAFILKTVQPNKWDASRRSNNRIEALHPNLSVDRPSLSERTTLSDLNVVFNVLQSCTNVFLREKSAMFWIAIRFRSKDSVIGKLSRISISVLSLCFQRLSSDNVRSESLFSFQRPLPSFWPLFFSA